jgi:hypothetical protein
MAQAFLSMDAIREAAGRAASKVLPDEIGETMPVVTRTDDGVRAIVLYFRVLGRRPNTRPTLPTHAMLLDPATAQVTSFRAVQPEEIGIVPPLDPVPGVRVDMSDMKAYLARRKRFFELSPGVWAAFAQGATNADTATDADVKEYWDLFRQLVNEPVAPYYTSAAKDFFDWVRAVAGAP